MDKVISKIQYISQGKTPGQHLENIKRVCQAGVDWVQLRMKNFDEKIFLKTALQSQKICKEYRATFIINDKVHIAKNVDSDGVHLGQKDMSIDRTRLILGEEKIIGITANSLQEIQKLPLQKINYIGLGPFAFTRTKKNLNPTIGIEGYQKLCRKIRNIPVIAVGGIALGDVKMLLNTGVYGVAVSGLLSKNINTQATVESILNEFYTFANN